MRAETQNEEQKEAEDPRERKLKSRALWAMGSTVSMVLGLGQELLSGPAGGKRVVVAQG